MKKAFITASTILSLALCTTAMAAKMQETGYYMSEKRDGLKTYKTQKQFEWITEKNQIIFSTVCMNERKGSLEYRECRKKAKDYFNKKCNVSSDRFCHAATNFNPL